ncbi:ABC transporter substrate-binding protein [Haloterrigena alkaliphila]|uniref:Twin-arginine translocation signal domain-containing protein n=1 Tax=Haloterrigena alkaliphila TaxID=2816475 RepID=A0A8A2V988_9EURY|nr:ABC transporter substrate-binding protein [Haloterrigena alkaliphila]QSW98031.1 ABC transporter substrate-binding protein [Haloterrigena alkaliphila]
MSRETDLSRRTFLKATGSGAAVATVAGCLTGDPDEGSDNELNLINSTVTTLDPIQSTDTASGQIVKQVYEALTYYPNGESSVENLLAEDVEISDDLLTYTFTLADAEFHNGDPLTADDFVYSLRRLAESPNSERANFVLEDTFLSVEHEVEGEELVPDSLGVEAVDDQTLEIRLETPHPNALELLAYDSFSAVPEGLVGDIEGYDGEIEHDEFSTETMIGTGPFEFDTWEPDAEARVTRFDDYHGSTANVEAVHWQIIEDDDAGYTYAMERNADIFGPGGGMPTAQYDPNKVDAETDDLGRSVGSYGPIENGDTVEYVGVPQLSTYYVAFNAPSVPRPVRRAIAYVTDHEELIAEVFKERGEEAWTFTPPGAFPGGQEQYESFIEDYPYGANETDRDAARQVLEDAGYTSDDPYELTLTTYESEVFQEFGRLTRDKLSGLGVDLSLEQSPFATLIERGENGELDFYSLGWTWSWPAADYGMFGFEPENTDTSRMPEETNGYYLDWHREDSDASAQAQGAWERVEANPDPDAQDVRDEAYLEMERAVWDDAVMIPLLHDLEERFIYDYVDVEPFGAMGAYQQRFNNVSLDE